MKKKNLLKGLLVSFMLLCAAHTWAFDFEDGNIQYTITSFDDMTVKVSGLTNTNVTEVTIPETVAYRERTLTVTSIASAAFQSNETLETASISNTVTSIGSYAFDGCTALKNVSIGNSVTSIGSYAFRNCTSLLTIKIPDFVTSINTYTFYGCSSLTDVTIPSSVTSIGSYAFYDCSSLLSVIIPNSVTNIAQYAFYGCLSLASVSIGNSVESIGTYAFYYCCSLKELNIPNSVTSFGERVLVGCNNIESLSVGAGLNELREYLEVTNTRYIRVTYTPLLWNNGPSQMKSIILRDDTSSFATKGYYYYSASPSTTLGYPIFSNIDVNYFYVGRPLTDINDWTIDVNTTRTQSAHITRSRPCGVVHTLEIGGCCTDVPYFYQSVEELILGENVETFTASNIYQGELTSITCRSATPPIVSGTFDNNTYLNVVLYVPIGSKETYQGAEGWRNFWNIEEADVSGIDDIVNSGDMTEVARYTLSGQKITTPQKGINIVHYSDGTTRKVLVQ